MTWYEASLDVIRGVVAENPGLDEAALRKKVSEAYPFGERAMFPYKAWLRAVTTVLGPSEKKRKAEKEKLDAILRKTGQGSLDVDA